MMLTVEHILSYGTRERSWAFTHPQSRYLFNDRFRGP